MLPLTTQQFPHKTELEGFEPSNARIKNECLNHLAIIQKKTKLIQS